MLIKQGIKDCLKYYIFNTRKEAGEKAAQDIAVAIKDMLKDKPELNVVFAAAPSQVEVLDALVNRTDIPWNRINAFHMDEYIGLPKDAQQLFASFLEQQLFARISLKSVNYIDGQAQDTQKECARYAGLLEKHLIDIVVLGIGENGHLAFNDPGVADFEDQEIMKVVSLDGTCRQQQVNDGCFCRLQDVPANALTLTIPALISANAIFCIVPSATKKEAVTKTINGEIDESCPATILRKHASATLYCDKDSGAGLL